MIRSFRSGAVRVALFACTGLLALHQLARPGYAANVFWSNPAGGVFSLPGNWGTGVVPGAGDVASFYLDNTYTVSFSTSPTNTGIDLGAGTITFNLTGQTYTTTASQLIGNDVSGNPSRLTLLNGTLSGLTIYVGFSSGGVGTFTASTNARFLGTGTALVGQGGAGTVSVVNGGLFSVPTILIGTNGTGIGVLNVTGTNSVATCTTLSIGANGDGVLNVTSGGVCNITGTNSVVMGASSSAATGSVNVSGPGSEWNVGGGITIGSAGQSSVTITSGGHVTTNGFVFVGSAGAGTVLINGAGARWDALGAPLTVGGGTPPAQVDILAGGVLNSGSTLLGSIATSVANITVSGANSTWNCPSVSLGAVGNASLTVGAGGAVNVGSNLFVNDPAGVPIGVLTIDGGTVTCESFTRLGRFNFNDGTLVVTSGIYQNGSAVGSLVIDGDTNMANPTLVLKGSGSVFNISSLTIGQNRNASLIVGDRALVNIPGQVNIGVNAASNGTVIVGGADSEGTGNARLIAAGTIAVGGNGIVSGGSGTLLINAGGNVSANGGILLGSDGLIQINGGTLTVANTISVVLGGQFNFDSGQFIFNFDFPTSQFWNDFLLGPTDTLRAGQTITPGGTSAFINGAPMTIDGGLFGNTFLPSGSFANSSVLTIKSGGVAVNQALTNNAGGVISINGTGFASGTTVINNGTIRMGGPEALLASNAFGSISNGGTVRGTGNVSGPFSNNASGQIQIGAGERLEFSLGSFTNNGVVAVTGGEAQFDSLFVNGAGGSISGHDQMLRFNAGLTNDGSLLVSAGQSDIYGNITNNSGGKIIVSGGGLATFYNPITNNSGAELRVSINSTGVFFGAVNGPGSITGSGLKIFEGGTSLLGPLATQTGSTIVETSASVTADNVIENSLTVSGQFTVRPNGTNAATSRLNSLTIDTGRVDLNDNDLVIDYTGATPYSTIGSYLATSALRSSLAIASTTPKTALGIAENSVLGLSNFSGQPVDSSSILIKYTFAGDANLDGQVDVTDLGALATNWQTANVWTGGDFNSDGFVDVTDLGALATNWQAGVGNPLGPSLNLALATLGLPVPEPIGIVVSLSTMLVALQGRHMRIGRR